MSYAAREVEIAYGLNGDGQVKPATTVYKVTATTGRSVAIVPGRFVVLNASSAGTVDGLAAADSVSGGTRLIVGLVKRCLSSNGTPLDRQKIGTAEAGKVEVYPARGLVFRCVEDAAGGAISASFAGSVGIAVGTITNDGTTDTNFTRPYSNDKLDSSTHSSTVTTNAFNLIGYDTDPRNASATAKTFLFTVNDGFSQVTP